MAEIDLQTLLADGEFLRRSGANPIGVPVTTIGTELILDEDDMASNSATKAPSQQSIKAYVDGLVGGGGGGMLLPFGALVYQASGNTIAVQRNGTVISSLATSSTNNATVIQAAIDYLAGTQVLLGSGNASAHGGGGTVAFADQEFVIGTTLVLKYGVNLWAPHGSIDRHGFSNYNQSTIGCTFRAPSGFAGPILSVGVSAGGVGSRVSTNPHGTFVHGITFAGHGSTSNLYAIRIRDTGQFRILYCSFNGFRGTGAVAVKLESTLPPDEGSLSCEVIEPYFTDNDKHMVVSGSGSTDGRIEGGRWLQHLTAALELGLSGGGGGWQIHGGHWTTGSNAFHINVDASPCIISDVYFDTTGSGTGGDNYHVQASSGNLMISNCHFKASGSGGPQAVIKLTGNGKKCTITGNSLLSGSGTKAFVEIDSAANQFAITGNNLDNDGAAWVSPVITAAGSAVTNNAASGRWIDQNPVNSMS